MTMRLVLREGENMPSLPASHYSSCTSTSYLVLWLCRQLGRKLMMVAAKLQSYIVQICSLPLVRILQTWAIACGGFLGQWSKEIGDSAHTVPAQKSNISKKIIGGRSLTFSFLKIIRRLLLFARLSYYFTLHNRLTDYSQQVHKLTKSSTLLSFWPAGFIPPPNDWKLADIFFPIWTFWARCDPVTPWDPVGLPLDPLSHCRSTPWPTSSRGLI